MWNIHFNSLEHVQLKRFLDNSKGPSNTFSDVAYHSQLMDSVIVTPKIELGLLG